MASHAPDAYSMSGALPDPQPQYSSSQPPLPQYRPGQSYPSPPGSQMLGPAGLEQQYSQSQSPRPPRDERPGYQTTDSFRPQRVSGSGPGPSDPGNAMTPLLSTTPHDIVTARTNSQVGLKEFADLVKKRQNAPPGSTLSSDIDARIRSTGGLLLRDLKLLRLELRDLARTKESHRWRRWLVGGAMATFFPAVKAILRLVAPSSSIASNASTDASYRPDHDLENASNDTEYAFRRSKTLLERIRTSVLGRGGVAASFAFFVFAALYVFQNEVALRVAKTMHRRVKKLVGKIEDGGFEIDERDLKTLEGWRWRVLLWGR